jgi:hypothetical protein
MFIVLTFVSFILMPGVITVLPPQGSKFAVAATHAVILALFWTLTHKFVWDFGVKHGWVQRAVAESMVTNQVRK